jgi:UDPglucose--hexose-1-phosphate uridylyltransferase
MMKQLIQKFVDLAIQQEICQEDVREEKERTLCHVFSCSDDEVNDFIIDQKDILQKMMDEGFKRGLFPMDTSDERDAFEAFLYDCVMDPPAHVKKRFKDLYNIHPEYATHYLYTLSKRVNYIKEERLKKNIQWVYRGKYGQLEITINLAKPEKDPRDIAKSKDQLIEGRPKCVLCKENEQNYWNARKNLRIIPITLGGETWHLQYSPYLYYDEHAIILHDEHRPMKIHEKTMVYLFDFVDQFPSYFIGSNADIPIVGGSILNHDHFQAGRYHFPIEDASIMKSYHLNNLSLHLLYWPLSTIRCISKDRGQLQSMVWKVYQAWKTYDCEELDIRAMTDGVSHQTITPIVRKKDDVYEVDLVLRNNRTSVEHPDGIFHPHVDVHHIKKENIGLIEAMGLAILPGRLKTEMEEGLSFLKGESSISQKMIHHEAWLNDLKKKNIRTWDELKREIGSRFERVIEDSGVFKMNDEGIHALDQFIQNIILQHH